MYCTICTTPNAPLFSNSETRAGSSVLIYNGVIMFQDYIFYSLLLNSGKCLRDPALSKGLHKLQLYDYVFQFPILVYICQILLTT